MSRNYTVVWDQNVEHSFAVAWTNADSRVRKQLTEIANWIDNNLAEAPQSYGRYYAEVRARMVLVPLTTTQARVTATYQVFEEDRLVRLNLLTFQL